MCGARAIPCTADDAIYLQAPHYTSTAYRDVAPGTSASYQIELVAQTEGYLCRNRLWLVFERSPVRVVVRSSAVRTGYWGFFSPCSQIGDSTLSLRGTQIFQKSMGNLKILGSEGWQEVTFLLRAHKC